MKIFEIDVSGEDLLNGEYSICVAEKNGTIIKGFKINKRYSEILNARYGQGIYNRYRKSQQGKANLKLRIYCVIIYYILKKINPITPFSLNLCTDFSGREGDIKLQLSDLLEKKLNLNLDGRIYFSKLSSTSKAHEYAYLMKKDTSNQLRNYVRINIEDIEEWLKK